MKKSATVNLMPEILQLMEYEATSLNLSRNLLIESQFILSSYERGKTAYLSGKEISGIVDGFSTNRRGRITAEFRSNIKTLSLESQYSMCAFLSALNFIESIRLSTMKMANIWLGDDVVCYLAIGSIGGQPVSQLIEKFTVATIGQSCAHDWVYFSKLNQLKIDSHYALWNGFLSELHLANNVDVLRVQPVELVPVVLPAIASLRN